jgi:hypothetical protein
MAFEQRLDNNLLFRTVRDDVDIQKYVAFNADYNNPNEGLNTNLLLRHLPGSQFDNFQLVADESSGKIVATTCLIPWLFSFEGIPLKAAQLEQVLSHPEYRRHGLVKLQIKRFMQAVAERQFDISFIWGIPYYYRQYGYSYCIEGNTFESLPSWRIPSPGPNRLTNFRLRPATREDSPQLTRLYRRAMDGVAFHIIRDDGYWRYLLEHARLAVQIVEDASSGQPAGYVGLLGSPDSQTITVLESGVTNQEAGWAVLQALKAQTSGEIKINWPKQGTLAQLARGLGSVTDTGGQWLFHFTDPAAFLAKIGPALERRLAVSDCAGLTHNMIINLFHQAYRLSFQSGKLAAVDSLGFLDSSMGADGGDLCIPPDAFVRLVLGYRGLDQLTDTWPDIVIKSESRHLVDTLFPRVESYLYAHYAYYG